MRKVIKMCKYCGKEFECDKNSTKEFCSQLCKSYFNGTRIKYNCEYCGKESSKTVSDYNKKKNHFCSVECKNKWQKDNLVGENNPHWKGGGITFNCDYCGKECVEGMASYNSSNNHFCSQECKARWQKDNLVGENNPLYNRVKCNCEYCGKEIEKTPSNIKNNKHTFCSQECKNKWRSKFERGENHPDYNPNLTPEERGRSYAEYSDWRKEVFERDNYTCQCCGDNKGHNLNAHHIYGYAEHEDLRTDVDNGVTLCEDCHKRYHKQYGIKNNDYKDFRTFLYNEMMKQNTLEARLFYINTIEDITLRLEIRGLLGLESA